MRQKRLMNKLNASNSLYVILIILLVLTGCSPNEKQPEIKIGGLFALTGYASFAGEASRDGFLMAIEDSDMDIKYVIEDFSSDTKTAVTTVTKLIDVDKVNVIIGPEWAEFGAAVAPLAEEKKMVFISPWLTTEPQWLREAEYYFSGTASERSQLRHLIAYMSKEKIKKFPDITIIEEFKVAQEANDFKTEITKVKELQPDAIYNVISTDSDQGILNKQ